MSIPKFLQQPRVMISTHRLMILQFIQFGLVGSTGLCLDITTVYLLRSILGLFLATLLAYFIAATSNWLINRLWTFKSVHHPHLLSQWIRFLMTNTLGFFCNRGVVFTLLLFSSTCRNTPYIPLMIGAITGMTANFQLSRKLVYTDQPY